MTFFQSSFSLQRLRVRTVEWFAKRKPACWPRLIADVRASPFSPSLLCGTAASENGQNASPPSPLGLLMPLGSTSPSYHRFDLFIGLCAFDPFRVFVCSLDLSGGSCATFCLDIFVSGVNNTEAAHPLHHVASCYFLSSGLHLSSVQYAAERIYCRRRSCYLFSTHVSTRLSLSQKIYRTWFGPGFWRSAGHSELFPQSTVPDSRAANPRGNARLPQTLHPPHRGFGLNVLPSVAAPGRGAKPCHGEREGASTHYEVTHEQ